jgi:hypothetical protein
MSCTECERLRWQHALARQAIEGLAGRRNDPDPEWQIEQLIEFLSELHDSVGAAFLNHRAAHRDA